MTEQQALALLGLVAYIVLAIIGYAAGASRGRGKAGCLLALFLGPVGWVIALLLPSNVSRYRRRRR